MVHIDKTVIVNSGLHGYFIIYFLSRACSGCRRNVTEGFSITVQKEQPFHLVEIITVRIKHPGGAVTTRVLPLEGKVQGEIRICAVIVIPPRPGAVSPLSTHSHRMTHLQTPCFLVFVNERRVVVFVGIENLGSLDGNALGLAVGGLSGIKRPPGLIVVGFHGHVRAHIHNFSAY